LAAGTVSWSLWHQPERTFTWIERNRRLLLKNEKLASSAIAFVVLTAAMVPVRRVAAT
jgi:hypothetical protein